jgi:hypothetical protein
VGYDIKGSSGDTIAIDSRLNFLNGSNTLYVNASLIDGAITIELAVALNICKAFTVDSSYAGTIALLEQLLCRENLCRDPIQEESPPSLVRQRSIPSSSQRSQALCSRSNQRRRERSQKAQAVHIPEEHQFGSKRIRRDQEVFRAKII